jgi:hypothetical protein
MNGQREQGGDCGVDVMLHTLIKTAISAVPDEELSPSELHK